MADEKKETKNEFINLDLLKTEKSRKVQFLGKTFEISYIPCGVAIPLVEHHNAQVAKEIKLMQDKKTISSQEATENQIKQVSLFCSFYDENFTEEYIAKNATDKQLAGFYTLIIQSIMENFDTIKTDDDDESDNENKKKQTGEK